MLAPDVSSPVTPAAAGSLAGPPGEEVSFQSFLPLLSMSPEGEEMLPSPEPWGEAPGPAEQVGSVEGQPVSLPLLSLAVQVWPEEAVPGRVVTVTVRLANASGAPAHGVVISGTLPVGLECPVCPGFFDPGTRRLQWSLPEFPAGQVITRTFSVPVGAQAGWEGGVALTLVLGGAEAPRAVYDTALLRVPYPLADGPADYDLCAFDGTGQFLWASTWGNDLPEEVVVRVPAGVYYVQLVGYAGDWSGELPYRLAVDVVGGGGQGGAPGSMGGPGGAPVPW